MAGSTIGSRSGPRVSWRQERNHLLPNEEVLMGKPIKDSDLLLAGQLAELLGAVGDIRIAGPIMTVPMRDTEGSLVFFEFDVRGLADAVEATSSSAVAAMGNTRGAQRAALALIANRIHEDHADEWDLSESGDLVYEADDDYEPAVIDMENFPPHG